MAIYPTPPRVTRTLPLPMKIDELAKSSAKNEARTAHAAALIAKLGNPAEWTFTGVVADAGGDAAQCACGHNIRWCFIITHPAKGRAQVGSTCIDHIAEITPELGARLVARREEIAAEIAATKAKAARAAKDAENAALWEKYAAQRDALRAKHKANRAAGYRSSSELWYFCEGWSCKYNRTNPPEYSRAADLKRWINKALNYTQKLLA